MDTRNKQSIICQYDMICQTINCKKLVFLLLQQARSIREKEKRQISVFPFNFIYITWGRFDLGQIWLGPIWLGTIWPGAELTWGRFCLGPIWPATVETDIGQVDLVSWLSDGTSEKMTLLPFEGYFLWKKFVALLLFHFDRQKCRK